MPRLLDLSVAASVIVLASCGSQRPPSAPTGEFTSDRRVVVTSEPGGFGAWPNGSRLVPNLAACLQASRPECLAAAGAMARAAATAPGAPVNLAATSSGSSVTLTWNAAPSGDPVRAYRIEAGSAPAASNLANFSTASTATSYSAAGVPEGVYYVRVRATNEGGVSAASNEVVISVDASCTSAPGAPARLSLVTNSLGTVVLSWGPASGSPSSYLVEAGSSPGQSNLASADNGSATTLTLTGVAAGTYYVRVRARNGCGTSAPSNEIVLTVSLATDPPPVLSVTIVDLSGTYDPSTRRLGAMNCTFGFANDPNDRWCFNAFGSATPGKQSPSFDYKVAAGATVFAAAPGTVFRLEAETNPLYPNEFEIETRSASDASYSVIYDHVKSVTVGVGSTVQPGMTLGTAGIHTTNPGVWGRVELQINRITQRTPTIRLVSLCPRQFGTDRFNQLHDAALAAHNSANPQYAWASVCLTDTLGPF